MDPKDGRGPRKPNSEGGPQDAEQFDKSNQNSERTGSDDVKPGDHAARGQHGRHAPDTVPDWSELGRGTRKSPKGVREILKAYFDDTQIDRADQYHSFFTSWKQLAGINIAAHTRPRDIRGGVLIVEADHPGWVQLLHMQKRTILRKIHREYPQLEVKEIRIVVGDGGENSYKNSNAPVELASNGRSSGESIQTPEPAAEQGPQDPPSPQASDQQYKRRFEDALKQLGKRVEERERGDGAGDEHGDENDSG